MNKRMKLFLGIVAFAIVGATHAQGITLNCTGGGAAPNRCTALTDAADPPPAVQPVACKIYNSATGNFVLATGSVSGPAGALFCSIALPTIAAGPVTLTSTFMLTDGTETPRSNVYSFTNAIPVVPTTQPPPKNLRATSP